MQKQLKISIPEHLTFQNLGLGRKKDGSITFNADVINDILRHSKIDPKLFWESDEDNMAGLIIDWYANHLKNGGAHDPVADDLIAEAMAEDESGSGISHKPGSA